MRIVAFEGIVDRDQIKLKTKVHLPDNTKVYVVVPGVQVEQSARIVSSRPVHPEQTADFKMEIEESLPPVDWLRLTKGFMKGE